MGHPKIGAWSVEEMTRCHFQDTKQPDRKGLWKFIAETIKEFTDNEEELTAQLLTATKIDLFYRFINTKIISDKIINIINN